MTESQVIDKLRELKLAYIQQGLGKNPAALPEHLAEFLGYATFIYDFYADFLERLEAKEAEVTQAEMDKMAEVNAIATKREERMTATEMEKRIDTRLAELKGHKKRLEQITKGATMHVNGCQSLMKQWGDEAKGVR